MLLLYGQIVFLTYLCLLPVFGISSCGWISFDSAGKIGIRVPGVIGAYLGFGFVHDVLLCRGVYVRPHTTVLSAWVPHCVCFLRTILAVYHYFHPCFAFCQNKQPCGMRSLILDHTHACEFALRCYPDFSRII